MSNTINTRIILRNDLSTNWSSSSVKIYKGEAALSLDSSNKYEIRFGIDSEGKTWNELGSSNLKIDANNVVGLLDQLYDYQLVDTTGGIKLQKKLHSAEDISSNWSDVTTVTLTFTGTYSNSNPIALKDYVDNAVANATTQYFEGIRGENESDSAAITRIVNGATVKGGSTLVIKTLLPGTTDKYSYIAFTYDTTTNPSSPSWKAMDGNYDWNTVYATENITATKSVGTITIPSSGSTTFAVAGKSVKQVFEKLLAQEQYPTVTQPSASITLTNSGAKEVGTSIAPAFKATFSAGSYTYGPATGVTSTASTVYHDATSDSDAVSVAANALNNKTGSFDSIVVTASTNFKAKLQWGSTAGATPVTNIGNDATQDQDGATGSKVSAIAAKSNQTATSSNAITGYVMGVWYGTLTSVVAASAITSANVRSLTGHNNSGTATGTFNMTVPVGAKTIVIAAKGSRTLTQVLNTTVNADMTESFAKNASVSVCGADAPSTDNANNYTVWTYSPAEAYASTAALTIKIA